MKVRVRKSGDSVSIRIPASIMRATSLRLDRTVELRVENGRIIIEGITAQSGNLEQLLDQLTPESFPEDIDYDPPTGREVW